MKSSAFRRSALACLGLVLMSGAQAATEAQTLQTFYDTSDLQPVIPTNDIGTMTITDVLSVKLKLTEDNSFDFPTDQNTLLIAPEGWPTVRPNPWSSAAIPEPATYALMGLGLIGIWLATRRRASV